MLAHDALNRCEFRPGLGSLRKVGEQRSHFMTMVLGTHFLACIRHREADVVARAKGKVLCVRRLGQVDIVEAHFKDAAIRFHG